MIEVFGLTVILSKLWVIDSAVVIYNEIKVQGKLKNLLYSYIIKICFKHFISDCGSGVCEFVCKFEHLIMKSNTEIVDESDFCRKIICNEDYSVEEHT